MTGTGEPNGTDIDVGWSPSPETPDDFGDQIDRRVRQTHLAALFLQSPSFMAVTEGPEHVFVNANPTYYDLVGERELIGRSVRDAFPELEGEGFFDLLDRVYETGDPYVRSEEPVPLSRGGPAGALETVYVSFSYHPLRDEDGTVSGILHHGIDVTERVESRRRLRRRVEQQTAIAELGRSVLADPSRPLPELLRRVVETSVEAMDADAGELYRHRSDDGVLVVETAIGHGEEAGSAPEIDVDRSHPVGRSFLDDRAHLSQDPAPESAGTAPGPASRTGHLATSIPGGDDGPVGVLAVRAEGPGAFSEADVPVLESAAQIAGAVVERGEYRRFTRTVARNLPGLLYRCRNDRDWTMEYMSEGTRALTGHPPSELTGEDGPAYADLIHPDDRDHVWRQVQNAVREERSFHLQYRIRARGGGEKWVMEQGRGVRPETGAPFLLEGYIFDITEWHEAEQEATRLESVLRAAFRGHSDAVFLVDLPERTVADCNVAAEEMFGRSRGELVGRSMADLHVDRESYERFHEESAPRLRETGSFRGEYRMRRADGTTFPTEHSVTCVQAGSTSRDRAISIVRDISERKRRQAELEHSRELLRKHSLHQTRAREEERAEIAREVHDELGQSLTALKLQLEQIRRREQDAAEAGEPLGRSLDLLDTIIGQVRELSSSLRPSSLDSLGLWDALGQLTRTFEQETGVHSRFRRPETETDVDPERQIHVYRIVQEALTNVARHADAGEARVEASREENAWVVRVLDDGVGLDGDPLDTEGGHGLVGMRERARLLGGELSVRTRSGGGTEVRLRIPPAPADH